MGKSASSLSQHSADSHEKQNKVFFLLHRTWAVIVTDKWNKTRLRRRRRRSAISEGSMSDFNSQYTTCTCPKCEWQEIFCSDYSSCSSYPEFNMAPNSEDNLPPPFRWDEDTYTKEKQRPPIYNPEDYASGVRKWARKSINSASNLYASQSVPELDCVNLQSATCRDYRNPMLTSATSEMSLRQFGTVSELLSKLKADLRLAYPSFIQEFVSDPHDGVTLLLELLRTIQLSQGNNNGSNTPGRIPPSIQRRALLDELTCLQCLLCCCIRYTESIHRLTASSASLFTLAVCIMTNVNKSRIIALQLLTKACEPAGNGHAIVSEAMSTLRLRFGEPVRFRFLIGMLTSAGGQEELLASGFKFINTFLDTAGSSQKRLYIQAELEQAGLDIENIKKIISTMPPSAEAVYEQLNLWSKNHIDIDSLSGRLKHAEKQSDFLKDKVLLLERRIQILQEEKGVLISLEQCLKERCSELQDEVLSLKSGKSHSSKLYIKKDDSTPAEDEGISSSERSLTPEDVQCEKSSYEIYDKKTDYDLKLLADEDETTIDDVIQELKNIVNDAETEVFTKPSKIQMNVLMNDPIFDSESEIVPANLQPQPPRRTRSLIHLYIPTEDYHYNREIFFDNETFYTSDEGSDSLLSASKYRLPRIEKDLSLFHSKVAPSRHIKKSETFHHRAKDVRPCRHNSIRILKQDSQAIQKKSKSLDRIDDGLDSMVDIIMTNQNKETPIIRPQSESGNLTTNLFLSTKKDFKITKLPTCGEKQKIFLPPSAYEHRNYFPRLQDRNFQIKKGPNNAGLYSDFHMYTSSGNSKKSDLSITKGRTQSILGKLTDLPSGLY